MFLTETIGEVMAKGIEAGLDLGLDIFIKGMIDAMKQNPLLAIALAALIVLNAIPRKKKGRRK